MYKSKVLVGFVLICYFLFAIFEFGGKEEIAFYFQSLIVPVITVFYSLFIKPKSKLFWLFLISYTLSDILGIIIVNLPNYGSEFLYDIEYYVCNSLYILAYMFLVFKIGMSINYKHVLKHLKMHVLVLTILNIYLLYVIHAIINPNLILESDYYLELTYNVVVLTLLSIALLNYFYRDNKKALYLFLGALCIVFSEVMDIAYIYVAQRCLLNFLGTTLALGAFYFFYQQSKLLNIINKEEEFVFVE
ncbi:hypothetical protein [uncultured Algibacter sp.]|uniref:hypothetical protein n=1 Tax=uncultured Algibacter sp. TaxID=298659 RepID=UPI00261A6600|nr:hypothetical protein [uncultured Algibacter sp.]